ncbi:hypothetical protein BYT27DRAFT_7191848 [Phlegmacium glaucopus]|nr:hypothetical protein BYT27DRAFT_7191848 [Phlegmacium glaucopus]
MVGPRALSGPVGSLTGVCFLPIAGDVDDHFNLWSPLNRLQDAQNVDVSLLKTRRTGKLTYWDNDTGSAMCWPIIAIYGSKSASTG